MDPPVIENQVYVWFCQECQCWSPFDFTSFTVSLCKFCNDYCSLSGYCKQPGQRKKELYKILFHQFKYPSHQLMDHYKLKTTILDPTCFARMHAYVCDNDIYINDDI